MLLTFIFFAAAFIVLYHLIVYPVAIVLLSSFVKEKHPHGFPDNELPTVALLISARNEEKFIASKLENSLQLDYPREKLRIIVLANGCTDQTAEITRDFADRGIELFEFGEIGKVKSQNEGVSRIDNDIVVFSDANTPYNQEAIRQLAKHFSDEKVAVVAGKHTYVNLDQATGATEAAYWHNVENTLKKAESKLGALLGAMGSIYAVRRKLYIPLPSGEITEDMFGPLLIAAKGYRIVYEPRAVAMEKAEATFAKEYARKEMVIHRVASTVFFHYPWMLNPFRTGRIAIALWSHKVFRWFTPALLMLMVAISLFRLATGKGARRDWAVFIFSTFFGFLATLGRGLGMDKPIPGLSHSWYLLMMFRAATVGLYKAIIKGGVAVWDHQR
ncbi:glycosyltransferase family 2 protein [Calditrichota bacterium]